MDHENSDNGNILSCLLLYPLDTSYYGCHLFSLLHRFLYSYSYHHGSPIEYAIRLLCKPINVTVPNPAFIAHSEDTTSCTTLMTRPALHGADRRWGSAGRV